MANDAYTDVINRIARDLYSVTHERGDAAMMGPAPKKKPAASTPNRATVDGRRERLRSMSNGWQRDNELYAALRDFLLTPRLADLTNQQGVIHTTHISQHQYERYAQSDCVSLYRERVRGFGFWNAVGRALGVQQEVLRLAYNKDLWVVNYYVPSYFVVAEEIKEDFERYWKAVCGGRDMVIVGRR